MVRGCSFALLVAILWLVRSPAPGRRRCRRIHPPDGKRADRGADGIRAWIAAVTGADRRFPAVYYFFPAAPPRTMGHPADRAIPGVEGRPDGSFGW
jgi:hypothetical protein